MISERRLKKWRRIALVTKAAEYPEFPKMLASFILELTQELLDQRLLKQIKRKNK